MQVKKALEKGNKEGAMIYGQNAIRKKNEALNFLKAGAAAPVPLCVFTDARHACLLRLVWGGFGCFRVPPSGTLADCLADVGFSLSPARQPADSLQLASRLDAVVSRLETQAKMNLINKSFAGIVKSLEKALNANNLEQARALSALSRRAGGRAGGRHGGRKAERPSAGGVLPSKQLSFGGSCF